MGIGSTLDWQHPAVSPHGVATEIWLPAALDGINTAFYDVWATFAFGLTLDLPPP